jgi:STE24 endopeptidase
MTAAFLLFLLFSGASLALEKAFLRFTENPWLVTGGYFLGLALLSEILFLPLSYYRSFVVEHRYGLSNESRRGWLLKESKSFLLSLAAAGVLTQTVYFFLRAFPRTWWILSFVVTAFFYIVLARLFPVLVLPLFYRLRKLADENLGGRLLQLCREAGVKVCGVFEMNLSKTTKRANAALMGFGRTRRIVMGDTLMENLAPDEIETVLAHELAHHKHRDIWLGLFIRAVPVFMTFFLADRFLHAWGAALGLRDISSVAGLPLLAFTGYCVDWLFLAPGNAISRWSEKRADRFAVRLSRNPGAFKSAMKKLAAMNLADNDPHPVVEFIFYSHPSAEKRIRTAEAMESANS